jgi:hypothetical protein
MAPRRGSGAAAPSGALRAIDASARPRLLAGLRPARLRRQSDADALATQGGTEGVPRVLHQARAARMRRQRLGSSVKSFSSPHARTAPGSASLESRSQPGNAVQAVGQHRQASTSPDVPWDYLACAHGWRARPLSSSGLRWRRCGFNRCDRQLREGPSQRPEVLFSIRFVAPVARQLCHEYLHLVPVVNRAGGKIAT